MKEVPSFGELDIPFANVSSPVIVFAPKGTSPEVIDYLQSSLKEITSKPKFAELLAKRGTGPVFSDARNAKATLAGMKKDVQPLVKSLSK